MKARTNTATHLDSLHPAIDDEPSAKAGNATLIKNIMRDEILHSTTEWQTEAQMARATSEAADPLTADSEIHEFGRLYDLPTFGQLRSSKPNCTH